MRGGELDGEAETKAKDISIDTEINFATLAQKAEQWLDQPIIAYRGVELQAEQIKLAKEKTQEFTAPEVKVSLRDTKSKDIFFDTEIALSAPGSITPRIGKLNLLFSVESARLEEVLQATITSFTLNFLRNLVFSTEKSITVFSDLLP